MLPFILALAGGWLIGDSMKSKEQSFAEGGELLDSEFWDDLAFLWRTDHIDIKEGVWYNTGKYKKGVNNSSGRYFKNEDADFVVGLANSYKVTLDDLKNKNPKFTAFGFYLNEKMARSKEFAEGGSLERKYKLGDKWRSDFDYLGMLEMGLKADVSWGVPKLSKLSRSFEDVNYHTSNKPLWAAIKLLESGDTEGAKAKLAEFHAIVKADIDEENSGEGFKDGGSVTKSYMGKEGDEVVIEKTGNGKSMPHTFHLTNANTHDKVDMMFDTEQQARDYAVKKGMAVLEKFKDSYASGGGVKKGVVLVWYADTEFDAEEFDKKLKKSPFHADRDGLIFEFDVQESDIDKTEMEVTKQVLDKINVFGHWESFDKFKQGGGVGSNLRGVKVTYSNGEVISTSMAANLTDKEITDYFKIGRKFNIGNVKDNIQTVKKVEILRESGGSVDKKAKGGKFTVPKKYTHFAVSKSDGKIVTGWEYKGLDKESIKEYTNMDLKDMDLKPSDFKILGKAILIRQGKDPFNWANWKNHSSGNKLEMDAVESKKYPNQFTLGEDDGEKPMYTKEELDLMKDGYKIEAEYRASRRTESDVKGYQKEIKGDSKITFSDNEFGGNWRIWTKKK